MLGVCFFTRCRLVLLLIIGLVLPMTIYGQDRALDPPASIVGETFTVVDHFHRGLFLTSYTLPKCDVDVILIADGDTLRTKTDGKGRFYFSGIADCQVTLIIEPINKIEDYPFFGTFELMPGENLVIVPWQRPAYSAGFSLQLSDQPLITAEGDTWVYHYPDIRADVRPRDEDHLVSKLIGMPGVEYNKRKHLLYISGDAVHRTFINGAFVFGLKQSVSQ